MSIFLSLRYGQETEHGDEDDHLEHLTGAETDVDMAQAMRDAVDRDPATHPGISGDS